MKIFKKRLCCALLCLSITAAFIPPSLAFNQDNVSDLWISNTAAFTGLTNQPASCSTTESSVVPSGAHYNYSM